MSVAKKIVGQGSIYFAGTIFSVVVGFFFKVFISRELGADMLGIFALGMSVVAVLSVFLSWGLGNGLVRFVSKYVAQKDYVQLQTYIYRTFQITFFMSCIGMSLFFLFPEFISNTILHTPSLTQYLPYFGILLLINAFIVLFDQIIRGMQEVKKSTLIGQFVRLPLKIILSVVFIYMGYALLGYIWAEIIGAIITVFLFYKLVKKITPIRFPRLTSKPQSKITREERKFGNNMLITNTVGLLHSQGDKIVLAYYLSTKELGVYAVVLTILAFVPTVLVSVNAIFTPIISQLFTEEKFDELKFYYQTSAKYIFILTFPLIVFLFLFREPVLNIFGNEFVEGTTIFSLMLFGQLINNSSGSVGMMLNMTGLEKYSRNISVLMSIVSLIVYIGLIPTFGLIGIGIGKLLVVGGQNLLTLYVLNKKRGILPFNKSYIHLIISFCIMVPILIIISNNICIENSFLLIPIIIITYLLFFINFLIVSSKVEKQFIFKFIYNLKK